MEKMGWSIVYETGQVKVPQSFRKEGFREKALVQVLLFDEFETNGRRLTYSVLPQYFPGENSLDFIPTVPLLKNPRSLDEAVGLADVMIKEIDLWQSEKYL